MFERYFPPQKSSSLNIGSIFGIHETATMGENVDDNFYKNDNRRTRQFLIWLVSR